jgi:hypothetical protein
MMFSPNATFIMPQTSGNDVGARRPGVLNITSFYLRGLGTELDDGR